MSGSARRPTPAVPGLPRQHRRQPVPAGVAGQRAARRAAPADLAGPGGTGSGRSRSPRSVLRRVGQLGDGAGQLTRALAVLGGPAPLRQPPRSPGLEPAPRPRGSPTSCAPPTCWPPGRSLEFAHPDRAHGHLRLHPAGRAGPGPRRGRPAAGPGGGRPPSASRSTCCAASRPATARVVAAAARGGRGGQRPRRPRHGRGLPAPRARRAARPRGPGRAILLDLGLSLAGERSPGRGGGTAGRCRG